MAKSTLRNSFQSEVARLEAELDEKDRLLNQAVRIAFRAGPALNPIIGGKEMIGPTVTSDSRGVMFAGRSVQVTIVPAEELIVIEGIGTGHHEEFRARAGKLDSEQIKGVLAVVTAIRRVKRGEPDPLVDTVNLTAAPMEPSKL